MIGLRVFDLAPWCRQVIHGVQHFAHGRPNWRLHVEASRPRESRFLSGPQRWDGIITAVLSEVRSWRRLMDEGHTKLVRISALSPQVVSDIPAVQVNDSKVAESIGKHLLAGGYRRLAYVKTATPFRQEDHRETGIVGFARSVNLQCDVFVHPYGASPVQRRAGLVRFLRAVEKPLGIVAFNMDNAREILDACQQAGVNVPDEAGVVAWDDDVLAETLEPSISAVVLPAERLGYEAANMLDQLLSGKKPREMPKLVEPTGVLHVRQSSDAASLQDRDVYLAEQYIREHATEPLKVPNIAHALRISRRKLEIDFFRVTGKSPHEMLMEVRLDRAKQLLVETDWQLAQIAEKSGLGTDQTLRRLFSERLGMTPGDYREKFRLR